MSKSKRDHKPFHDPSEQRPRSIYFTFTSIFTTTELDVERVTAENVFLENIGKGFLYIVLIKRSPTREPESNRQQNSITLSQSLYPNLLDRNHSVQIELLSGISQSFQHVSYKVSALRISQYKPFFRLSELSVYTLNN